MIDARVANTMSALQSRKAELLEAYEPGFFPADSDVTAGHDKLRPSMNPLSVVAPEETYFVASDTMGRSFYSRNGDFHVVDGTLRTPNGSQVMGFGPRGDGQLMPLRLEPVDVALHRYSDVRIDPEGRLSYVRRVIDPQTGKPRMERVTVGTIALARFPAGTQLSAPDGVHVTSAAGVSPALGVSGRDGFDALRVGMGDHGRLDVKRALAAVRDAYIQYDAVRSANDAHGNGDKTVMDLVK